MKNAFIAVLGRPNVGKSSLINAMVGEKVSIVSPKPQTTRDKIMGVLTTGDFQMVFVDTPGIHAPKNKLDNYMQRCVKSASDGADGILFVIDGERGLTDGELRTLEQTLAGEGKVFVAVNKTDIAGAEKIFPILSRLTPYLSDGRLAELIPTSAKTGSNIDVLRAALESCLKPGQMFFPADEYTDKSERFMICEIIREKALLYLQEEIPHGVGVYILKMTSGKLTRIEADIVCERESHKRIIIGEKGAMLGKIGTAARRDVEELLGVKVFLQLFVKVRPDWRNKQSVIRDVGYES